MARLLNDKGYKEVWPLEGGFDAWYERGFPVERIAPEAPGLAAISTANSSV
jgi:3-mercaptopyruvate sulfurtransferase SseA